MPRPIAKTVQLPSQGDDREVRDRRIVGGLIGIFVAGALWLASLSVVETSRKSSAKASMGQTFAVVHRRQSEFRSVNGRFATWPELRRGGARLGPQQTVAGSNADASHWFISIRDDKAGVICDRIGELMDEDRFERSPVCRDAQ